MSAALSLFVGLVLSSAVALVVAVVLAVEVLRHDRDLPWPKRLGVALVAPWAAVRSARRGRRAAPGLFAFAALTYVALWVVAASLDRSA